MSEEHKKQIIEKLISNNTQAHVTEKSKFHKFAIAALFVLVPAVIAIYIIVSSMQKIEIPPELASMSVENLVKLNYDASQTTFDPNIVKYALKQALEKTAPEEVIKIAKSLRENTMKSSASRVALPAHPVAELAGDNRKIFSEVVEESNVFVHARLLSCQLNVDDVITAIIEKENSSAFEDFMSKYKVTIQLYIIDCLPKNMLRKDKTITIPTILYEKQLNALKKNSEYYFAMRQNEGRELRFLDYFSGVYPVDSSSPANMELWQFFKDAQDILLFGQSPKPETIEYWISQLKDDTFLLALEYMNVLPDDLIPANSIMDALEKRYRDFILYSRGKNEELSNTTDRDKRIKIDNGIYKFQHSSTQLFEETISLLLRSGNKESIRRMLSLVDEDLESNDRGIIMGQYGFNSRKFPSLIVSMVVASEENSFNNQLIETYAKYKNRPFAVAIYGNVSVSNSIQPALLHDLTIELLNQLPKQPIKEVQTMLSNIFNNPPESGLYEAADFKKLWMLLGSNELYDMQSYLENFLADPNLSDIRVREETNGVHLGLTSFSFEQAAFEVLSMLPGSARPSHSEMINLLVMIYERNKGNQRCVSFTINTLEDIIRSSDTECVPVLKDLLSVDRPNWVIPQIIQKMASPALIPDIRTAINDKKFDREAPLIEALYNCGAKDEAITKALGLLAEPVRDDSTRNMLNDLRRNAGLILILGKTQNSDFIPVIEGYTSKQYFDRYRDISNDLEGMLINFTLEELKQNAIIALARLGGKSSVPRLREIYRTTDDIRAKIVAALGLYYNGDKMGEKLLRNLVEGTHRQNPEIAIRWGNDISDGTVFQDVIKSYLRNELTDTLWLEKLSFYLDRADTDTESDFFKDHRDEILQIMIRQLDNKNRTVRGYACEVLQKAAGKNFGFDADRYAGQQEEIIQRWREYLNSSKE